MPKKLNTQNFIEKSKIVHNDKYDYSLVEYKGAHSKVKIICPIHGEFEQQAYSHLQGYGCKKCSDDERRNNKWLDEFNKIHNNKYDYSLVEYKNTHSKIKIICPVHGIFEQYFQSHFDSGCNKCKRQENFINNSKKKHGDKYDYSLVDYVDKYTKVKIICPEHGEFIQTPLHHIRGCGCKLCADDSKRWNKEKFIKKLGL